jgi:RNA recognition motif. (a.k.a. RRM, RBD, or RNP domain)
MMRHRAASQPDNNNEDVSSDDDDDAFTALSRKRKVEVKSKDTTSASDRFEVNDVATAVTTATLQSSTGSQIPNHQAPIVVRTSSSKRHHGEVSDARKAKMDAILLELQAETTLQTSEAAPHGRNRRTSSNNNSKSAHHHHDSNEQRTGGSFVDPGDEHVTTNVFVGNLAPSVTEEQMTELFRQFGENRCFCFVQYLLADAECPRSVTIENDIRAMKNLTLPKIVSE